MVEASLVIYAEIGVLVIGVIIALQQLRDIKQTRKTELETRQAQLFMQKYNRFNSKAFARADRWPPVPYSFRGQFYILFFGQVIGKTYVLFDCFHIKHYI